VNGARDYYQVLGVAKGSSKDDIKKAYQKLARKYHPDVSTEPDHAARMLEINEAWSVLGDGQKRIAYDKGESVLTQDELEAQAKTWLHQHFAKAVDEDQPNIVAWVRQARSANENALRAGIADMTSKRNKLEIQRKKILVKATGRRNLAYEVIDEKIRLATLAVSNMTKGLGVLEIVSDLITDYDDVAPPPPPPQPTTTTIHGSVFFTMNPGQWGAGPNTK